MQDFDSARGYSDGDVDTNTSDSPSLNVIVAERYSRRQTLLGGLGASSAAFLGTTLIAACDFLDSNHSPSGFVVDLNSSGTTTAGNPVTLNGSMIAGTSSSVQWSQVGGPAV